MAGSAASCRFAKCAVGVRTLWPPNGLSIVDTARFSLFGVLLKLRARPTLILVLVANLLKTEIKILAIAEFLKSEKGEYSQIRFSNFKNKSFSGQSFHPVLHSSSILHQGTLRERNR